MIKSDAKGITLIELIIVVSIIAIIVVALGFSFQGWMGRYRIESQVKEMHVDLMNARARAMARNLFHFVDFPTTTTYRLSVDDSNGVIKVPDGDGTFQPQANPAVVTVNTDTTLPTFPKTVEYPVTWAGGTIRFDNRGIVQPSATPLGGTICLFTDSDGDGASDTDPDYDCIIISQTRINTGKLTTQNTAGGICDTRTADNPGGNCVAK